MERRNEMKLEFEALSVNEGFARVAVAAFCARMNPTLDELEDIKTAVSEAVTNAIIHGYEEKEGTVVMQCCLSGSTVHITVKDSGKGIAENRQGMIFKRFYREEEVHDVDGIGIGLYLAREIVTMQGGYIKVTSAPGRGSAFSVFLPLR